MKYGTLTVADRTIILMDVGQFSFNHIIPCSFKFLIIHFCQIVYYRLRMVILWPLSIGGRADG